MKNFCNYSSMLRLPATLRALPVIEKKNQRRWILRYGWCRPQKDEDFKI